MRFILRHTSLFFKVIFVTSLILIFAISFNVWWNTSLHGASIEKLTHEKTKIIAEFIEENVIRAMEKGRHFDMHRILKNYVVYKDVRKIFLFSMDGIIRASTQDDELNKKVTDVEFYLKDRDFIREEMVQLKDGKKERGRVYYYNTLILNRPECFQCHDKGKKIIGVLTVANSLKEMETMIWRIEIHSIILAIITIAFLILCARLPVFEIHQRPDQEVDWDNEKSGGGRLHCKSECQGQR